MTISVTSLHGAQCIGRVISWRRVGDAVIFKVAFLEATHAQWPLFHTNTTQYFTLYTETLLTHRQITGTPNTGKQLQLNHGTIIIYTHTQIEQFWFDLENVLFTRVFLLFVITITDCPQLNRHVDIHFLNFLFDFLCIENKRKMPSTLNW